MKSYLSRNRNASFQQPQTTLPDRSPAKARSALYKPPPRWHFFAALVSAIALEATAVAVASLQEKGEIPTVAGVQEPPAAEGVFMTDLAPEATPPPEETPPPLPPDPVEPADFVIEQSTPPPRPENIRNPQRKVAISAEPRRSSGPPNFSSGPESMLSAPRPGYPYEARRAKQTGSGKFLLTFAAEGSVIDVQVVQSTGSAILDQTSVSALRRWRCRPGVYERAYVPITYTLTGAQL